MSTDTATMLMNLMIAAPLLGVPFILAMKSEKAKYFALLASSVPFVFSILVYIYYLGHSSLGNADVANATSQGINEFVLSYSGDWWFNIPGADIKFITALDGISIYLVLLTTFLFPLTIWFSFGSVEKFEKPYYALLLVLETGVLGFFMSLDLVLFYIFFEMVLIPMYFLIGIWGGKERVYASIKFFLYTLIGSLLMMIAIIYVGFEAGKTAPVNGSFTSDYFAILNSSLGENLQIWLFLAFTIAFAIKVPLFPLHTWLPDAHTQAPTAGSVILAGVLLKMGTYGLIRFCLPFFPYAADYFAGTMCALAMIGIIYGGMAAMVQTDVKKLVAYSSVSHLGFIVLGIFSFTPEALNGAVIQMVNHGVTTGGLFLLVGMIYDRRHTRAIADYQGIARVMPKFTLLFMITMLASVGLPGLNGFVGEFMILLGSFENQALYTVLSTSGVIVAAVYLLWMFRRVFFGELDKEPNKKLVDLNGREVAVMLPLVVLMFWMGFNAKPFLQEIDKSTRKVLNEMKPAAAATPPVAQNAVPFQPH